jgi:hypothetical protein
MGGLMPSLSITRYGSRNWAVWCDGELLAVTLYRKGAEAVVSKIQELTQNNDRHFITSPTAPEPTQWETSALPLAA